ncbi:NUDIX domain-containing protein [Solibacillus sp. CAU 1738]|uniref:NUDIX domain-containing protein n=1 Tax=Solibacillus sp. CAU 1738 TaxID=3140363 RepID=UPI0032609B71
MLQQISKTVGITAGKREEGETPLECALRELQEETSQKATDLTLRGLLKSINKQDGQMKYNPVFIGEVKELVPFEENEEIAAITLWDLKTDIGRIDELDFRLFSFVD